MVSFRFYTAHLHKNIHKPRSTTTRKHEDFSNSSTVALYYGLRCWIFEYSWTIHSLYSVEPCTNKIRKKPEQNPLNPTWAIFEFETNADTNSNASKKKTIEMLWTIIKKMIFVQFVFVHSLGALTLNHKHWE